MIGAALIALVAHIQFLPVISAKTGDLQPGAVIYAEPSSGSRFSLIVTHTPTSTGVKLGARWTF